MLFAKVLCYVSSKLYFILPNSALAFSVTISNTWKNKRKSVQVYSEITLEKRVLNGTLSLLVNTLE